MAAHQRYRKKHPPYVKMGNFLERHRATNRKWAEKNKDKVREKTKRWIKANRERVYENQKRWAENNPAKAKAKTDRANAKKRATPKGRLSLNFSRHIRYSLHGGKKGIHWEYLVGYTVEQLKKHLEKQFVEDMSWENYGKWHIDHKIPVSAFNYEKPEDEDFKRCWDLKNLQPLWAADNHKKKAKINKPMQPSLIFGKPII